MRFHSTLLGTAFVTFGGAACGGAWAATSPSGPALPTHAGPARTAPVAQVLILAAAAGVPDIVTIDGVRWRRAPASEDGTTGAAGTRIILDGELWLRADDTVFGRASGSDRAAVGEDRPVPAPAPAVAKASRQPSAVVPVVAPVPVVETPAEIRSRQRRLMEESRRREAVRSRVAEQRSDARGLSRDAARRAGLLARAQASRRDRERAEAGGRAAAAGQLAAERATARENAAARAAVERNAEQAAEKAIAAQIVAEQAADDAVIAQNMTASALRLPPEERTGDSSFSYVQLMPVSYDIGGAGVMFEGSTEVRDRFHLMVRAGIAERYQEALVGAGVHYTPPTADRLTVMLSAGYEYSVFPLESERLDLTVDDASAGPFVTAAGRLVLNPRFMLEGGVGYSSFHEGDPFGFGSGFFHVNDVLDLMSRIELGDQDSYGIGIRVNY